jgi:dephospho-CoA kinase
MLKIGITGCIGSGKSLVTKIFAQLGVPVYDADSRAKYLMNHSEELRSQLIELLGEQAYTEDGHLNRSFVAGAVFENTILLNKLNGLIHPAVFHDFDKWITEHAQATYIIKEAALMFETDSYKQLDQIITVTAPQKLRIERVVKRDRVSESDVLKRMNNQLSQEEKLSRSQYEVINDESVLLIPQVLSLHQKFQAMVTLQNSPKQ